MKRTICSRILRAAGLLVVAALVPIAHLSASPAPTRVTIAGLKGPTSIGMLHLLEQKPTIDGSSTHFEIVSTPDLMVARILTGSTDFAFLPLNLAANLYAKGVPVELAATTGDGVLYLLTSRSDVHSVADLRGKRIYNIARGSTPEFMLDFVLERNGIDPSRGVMVDYTYSHIELAQAMAAGRVDLGVLPEPFATIALSKNPRLHIVVDFQKQWARYHGGGAPYPTSALVVRRALAEQDPSLVSAFLEAERASIAWVVAHPAAAGALAERYLGMPGAVVAAAMPRLNLRFASAAAARDQVQTFLEEFLSFDPQSIGGKLPDSGFYFGR